MLKKAENLERGDSITVDGVRFVVKDKVLLLGGQIGILFEDMPATEENVAAFRKLQEETAGTGILAPVGPGCKGWRYSKDREITKAMSKKKMSEMDWRPWMEVAVEQGGQLCPYMEPGGVYLYQMFSTTFVRFQDKEAAENFRDWAEKNLPYWGYDPVTVIDTNDPEVCKTWAEHIKPEKRYSDSALHKEINLEFGRLENGVCIPASYEATNEAGKWWVRSPDPKHKELDGTKNDVIIVVEDGRVTEVYATSQSIDVTILDMDTTDAYERESVEEELKKLRARIEAGELHDVL